MMNACPGISIHMPLRVQGAPARSPSAAKPSIDILSGAVRQLPALFLDGPISLSTRIRRLQAMTTNLSPAAKSASSSSMMKRC
jgi:hypothetical protein